VNSLDVRWAAGTVLIIGGGHGWQYDPTGQIMERERNDHFNHGG
jgi:hypothetical protein